MFPELRIHVLGCQREQMKYKMATAKAQAKYGARTQATRRGESKPRVVLGGDVPGSGRAFKRASTTDLAGRQARSADGGAGGAAQNSFRGVRGARRRTKAGRSKLRS